MSAATTKPAMTPEQWAALRAVNGFGDGSEDVRVGNTTFGYHALSIFEPDRLSVSTRAECDGIVDHEARHAFAAACLHDLRDEAGQPLGFTWDDVIGCRAQAALAREGAANYRGPSAESSIAHLLKHARTWDDLADRIAALLPPRDDQKADALADRLRHVLEANGEDASDVAGKLPFLAPRGGPPEEVLRIMGGGHRAIGDEARRYFNNDED